MARECVHYRDPEPDIDNRLGPTSFWLRAGGGQCGAGFVGSVDGLIVVFSSHRIPRIPSQKDVTAGTFRDAIEEAFPSQSEWDIFWASIDDLDAWGWGGHSHGCIGGRPWDLIIRNKGSEVLCCGNGCDAFAPSKFSDFLRVLTRLVGSSGENLEFAL